MPHNYDLCIAGLGPAGAAAALAALTPSGRTTAHGPAGRPLSVLACDKARFPRTKLCGGLLTLKARRVLAALGVADILDAPGVTVFSSAEYGLYHGARLLAEGRAPEPFVLIDRTAFDAALLGRVRTAGAALGLDLRTGVGLIEADPDTGRFSLDDGFSGHARWIVGADGVHSKVRRGLPEGFADRAAWRAGMAQAVELFVDRARLPGFCHKPLLYGGYNTAGYAWAFPQAERLVLGMCEPPVGTGGTAETIAARMARFCADLGLQPAPGSLRGHPLPYGNFLSTPHHGRVLLAGDAAGYADPLLGEGVFYALATGRAAGLAAALGDPDRYEAFVRRRILPEMLGARRLRRLFRLTELTLGPAGLGLGMRLAAGRLGRAVHGLASWNGPLGLGPARWPED